MPSRGRDRHHVVISEHSRSEGVFVVKVLHDDEERIAALEQAEGVRGWGA